MVHRGVVLWASGPVVCTCTHLPEHRIEIRLSVEGVEVDVAVFPDNDSASTYAITQMHAYNAA